MYISLLKGDLLRLIQPDSLFDIKKMLGINPFKWEHHQYILNGRRFIKLKFNATYHEYVIQNKLNSIHTSNILYKIIKTHFKKLNISERVQI